MSVYVCECVCACDCACVFLVKRDNRSKDMRKLQSVVH